MSVAEIIEQIGLLSLDEQNKIVEFVKHLPNEETVEAMKEAENPEKLESFENADAMFESLGIKCSR